MKVEYCNGKKKVRKATGPGTVALSNRKATVRMGDGSLTLGTNTEAKKLFDKLTNMGEREEKTSRKLEKQL